MSSTDSEEDDVLANLNAEHDEQLLKGSDPSETPVKSAAYGYQPSFGPVVPSVPSSSYFRNTYRNIRLESSNNLNALPQQIIRDLVEYELTARYEISGVRDALAYSDLMKLRRQCQTKVDQLRMIDDQLNVIGKETQVLEQMLEQNEDGILADCERLVERLQLELAVSDIQRAVDKLIIDMITGIFHFNVNDNDSHGEFNEIIEQVNGLLKSTESGLVDSDEGGLGRDDSADEVPSCNGFKGLKSYGIVESSKLKQLKKHKSRLTAISEDE